MNKLSSRYTNEQTGISYTLVGDYYLPDLALPGEPHYDIGRFGLMRRNYLKNHRKGLFATLLTSGKLNEHLHEIDRTAHKRFELISNQIAKAEQLKAQNQMLWVQKINSIRSRVEEMIREELIYS